MVTHFEYFLIVVIGLFALCGDRRRAFVILQAVAYLLLQEALKGQMAQQVKKKEEKEQLESIPLIELLRLAAGDSQKEEQHKVCLHSSSWLLLNNGHSSSMIQITIGIHNL